MCNLNRVEMNWVVEVGSWGRAGIIRSCLCIFAEARINYDIDIVQTTSGRRSDHWQQLELIDPSGLKVRSNIVGFDMIRFVGSSLNVEIYPSVDILYRSNQTELAPICIFIANLLFYSPLFIWDISFLIFLYRCNAWAMYIKTDTDVELGFIPRHSSESVLEVKISAQMILVYTRLGIIRLNSHQNKYMQI